MTDQPLPIAKLRSHGEADRKLELELGPAGPWQARVTVHAVKTNHGRQTTVPHEWLFEIAVEWTGPPAVGMPAARGPVSSRDVYVLPPPLEDAATLARKVFDAYRSPGDEPADLRELAGVIIIENGQRLPAD
jgi:hypothetical protein